MSPHQALIAERLANALPHARDFSDLCIAAEGADPREIERILDSSFVGWKDRLGKATALRMGQATPRSILPAEDPNRSQWWFTPDTAELLVRNVEVRGSGGRVGLIGCPTLALRLKQPTNCIALDSDVEVVSSLIERGVNGASVYDVRDPLPEEYVGEASIVAMDPPWYQPAFFAFLRRGFEMLAPSGTMLLALPRVLTRPGAESERDELLDYLSAGGCVIHALEHGVLRYEVPAFEAEAFRNIDCFTGRPWRTADLLVVKVRDSKKAVQALPAVDFPVLGETTFSRPGTTLRCFVCDERVDPSASDWITRDPEFERNISTRAFEVEKVGVTTSRRRGGRVRDVASAKQVLSLWSQGLSMDLAVDALIESGLDASAAGSCVRTFDEVLELWKSAPQSGYRRDVGQIRTFHEQSLSTLSSSVGVREHALPSDGFRDGFQRDRDRVLWAPSMKRLAHKTQVFALEENDRVRQRLTHSIEVMQLASTIGTAFGLDPFLIEAGSLAHDIGHTPFGHAGEHALDQSLRQIHPELTFNHYEHGVDVVRWLEGPYQGSHGHRGLNLAPEVVECILKHTYCQQGTGSSSFEEVYRKSKHRDQVPPGFCHIEGQAVRLADKVSYLISDLEDGLLLGAFELDDIRRLRLMNRTGIVLDSHGADSDLDAMISARRGILQVLMEDAIQETENRLRSVGGLRGVRSASDYTVRHSRYVSEDIGEVWKKLQAGRLHKDARVQAANIRAARIVSELLLIFAIVPELVDASFREEHELLWNGPYLEYYRKSVGKSVSLRPDLSTFLPLDRVIGRDAGAIQLDTCHVVMAKDYVASLSDFRARQLHATLVQGR